MNPTDATRKYASTTAGLCSVNPTTGAVTAIDDGNCGIKLTLSRTGYTDKSNDYIIAVSEGTFTTITWANFPNSVTIGSTTGNLGSPASDPVADTYDISISSGDCSWDNAARTLSFTGGTKCVVQVTANKTGYVSYSRNFEVTPGLAGIAVTNWGEYGTLNIGDGSIPAPALVGVDPTDAAKSYASQTESICTVDESSGAVSEEKEGTCIIRLTLSKSGYNDTVHDYSFDIGATLDGLYRKYLFRGLVLGDILNPIFFDVDGDGREDLVVGSNAGTLQYFKKEASGYYTRKTGSDNPFNGINVGRLSVPAFSDVDGDGDTDLVVGVYGTTGVLGQIYYYEKDDVGDGYTQKTGAANPFNSVRFGNYVYPVFVNLTGDSKLDLLIGNNFGKFQYYEKDSTGSTYTSKTSPISNIGSENHVRPRFVNLDSDADLELVLSVGNSIRYYDKVGSSYVNQTGENNPFNGFLITSVATAFSDRDGDGDQDLVVGTYQGILHYYSNNAGTFTKDSSSLNYFVGLLGGEGRYSRLSFANMDDDAELELVQGGYAGQIAYFDQDSNGRYVKKTGTDNPFNGFDIGDGHSNPVLINIDNDDDIELVVGGAGKVSLYDKGESGYAQKTGNENPFNSISGSSYAVDIDIIDFDGNGKLDIFWSSGVVALKHYEENDSGNFVDVEAGLRSSLSAISTYWKRLAPTLADIGGDDRLDLIIGHQDGHMNYYEREASGLVGKGGADNPVNGIHAGSEAGPVFIDMDDDGDDDLVLGRGDGNVHYYENTDSGFTRRTGEENNPLHGVADVGNYAKPTFGDVDNDGDLDLLIGNFNGTFTYYEYDDGDFTLKTGAQSPFNGLDVGYRAVPVFYGTGPKLLVGSGNTKLRHYVKNNSGNYTESANTSPYKSFSTPSTASAPTLGDVNGDGAADLIVGEYRGALLFNLTNEGVFKGLPSNGVSAVPVFADINGDGRIDAFVGTENHGIYYYQQTAEKKFVRETGANNPLNGLTIGTQASIAVSNMNGDEGLHLIVTSTVNGATSINYGFIRFGEVFFFR